ncbi:hypothetical protein YC2023_065608 [Brassica napus]
MHSDVRAEEDDIINAVDFVVKRFGKLDILINYAEHHHWSTVHIHMLVPTSNHSFLGLTRSVADGLGQHERPLKPGL